MKKLLSVAVLSFGLIFALASATPAGEDASTSRRDAGSTDTRGGNDAGSGTDAGGGTWLASNYGQPCNGPAQCPGGECTDLFAGGGTPACFKACSSAANCTDFPYNASAVECAPVTQGGPSVCIIGSGQNGPCGNPLNATCTDPDYSLCGTDSNGYGNCVKVCNPHDPTNANGCRVAGLPATACGCTGTDECSATLLGFESGVTDDPDGICSAPTAVGATCGLDQNTLIITPCTGGLACDGLSSSSSSGTCATPTADGGMGTDATVEDI